MKKITLFLLLLLLLVISSNLRFCAPADDRDMVEVTIHGIQGDARRGNPVVVVLTDSDRKYYMPLVVDAEQARALTRDRNGTPPHSPGTHDLLAIILSTLNAKVIRVEVDRIGRGKWQAWLFLEDDGELYKIDVRPGDALAVAQRMEAKIYVPRASMQSRPEEPSPEASSDDEGGPETLSLDDYGFSVQHLTPGLQRIFGRHGVLISDVAHRSPAEKAGLQSGDLLTAINGESVDSPEHTLQLIESAPRTQPIRLRIKRNSEEIELLMQL